MRKIVLFAAAVLLLVTGCSASSSPAGRSSTHSSSAARPAPTAERSDTATVPAGASAAASAAVAAVPRFSHIVLVVEENHASSEVVGSRSAPYLNYLARTGALLTRSYAITHPSYPNYLALFSGSTHGITDDSCPHYYAADNLGHQLRARHLSFASYAQSLPATGYRGCTAGSYARRHVPAVDFTDLPRSLNKPMRAFPSDYSKLPTVSMVIPNLNNDMHDGTVRQADTWLHANLGGYTSWARKHNSLLIVTWDEDDRSAGNHIPTLLVGAHVRTGHDATRVDHYRMLRTIEAAYGLAALGTAKHRSPVTTPWVH